MKMHDARMLLAALFLLGPTTALAATDHYWCAVQHFVRNGGAELRSHSISFRNPDLSNAATVDRITIRNVFGTVVHDSGPVAGVAHPLNTDFTSPLDITTVPPGANFYLNTRHIWGNSGLPVTDGNNEAGLSMSATVVVTKKGRKDPVIVGVRGAARDRDATPAGFVDGAERSSTLSACTKLD